MSSALSTQPTPTTTSQVAWRAGVGAIDAIGRGWPVALLATALPAALCSFIELQLLARFAGPPPHDQSDLIAVVFSWSGYALLESILLGPLVAATAVFLARAAWRGEQVETTAAVNYAIARYGRLFAPNLAAQVSIQLGMVIFVPGLLFYTMYALVPAVACNEDDVWALDRSKALTVGRRKALFLLWLPLAPIALIGPFVDLSIIESGAFFFFLDRALTYLLMYWLAVGAALIYYGRTHRPKPTPPA
jgi:hypothetical protein